jgi:hypothetical protein
MAFVSVCAVSPWWVWFQLLEVKPMTRAKTESLAAEWLSDIDVCEDIAARTAFRDWLRSVRRGSIQCVIAAAGSSLQSSRDAASPCPFKGDAPGDESDFEYSVPSALEH